MHTIDLIENYIIYLNTACGLSVTLHPMKRESLISFSRLMQFNIHDNSYCSYIKSAQNDRRSCRAEQREIVASCPKEGKGHVCFAGVFEYVYPIFNGEEDIGFISVSGYSCPEGKSAVKATAERLDLSEEALKKIYSSLPQKIPDKTSVDTLILPLCRMLELAYLKEEKSTREESMITRILRYIRQHYSMDLTTEELCARYHCSRSHFSHTFKKETGKSFREYLTALRLEHAKHLLKHSSMRVGEIAFSVGFSDPNYFSNVFRQIEGISPIEYRKKNK